MFFDLVCVYLVIRERREASVDALDTVLFLLVTMAGLQASLFVSLVDLGLEMSGVSSLFLILLYSNQIDPSPITSNFTFYSSSGFSLSTIARGIPLFDNNRSARPPHSLQHYPRKSSHKDTF